MADDDDAPGQRLDVVHVMRGQQHRGAAFAVGAQHELAHGQLGGCVQADGGLVQEQDLGLVQQGRGDLGAHALAQGQLAHGLVQQPLQVQHGHQLVAGARKAQRIDTVQVAQQVEAVVHGQVPPQLRALSEDHADAAHMALAVGEGVAPVHLHAPAIGPQDARQDLDGGGLARPVGTDEAQQLATLQRERHTLQRLHRAVARAHQRAQRAHHAGVALMDAVGLAEVVDEDLGHGAGR